MGAVGDRLADIVPEFGPLLALSGAHPERAQTAEVQRGAASARRTLLVRIGPEMRGAVTEGYVVTFDDITELQSAQRKAAWADVARRIAHEIKNPLTPIQLSAERLKRRFLREITSDPDTFSQCADTIVRHVEDIGRMVDEFSAFARMPQPMIRPEDLSRDRARDAGAAEGRPSRDRLPDPAAGPRAGGALRPPADRPGADQPAAECRRRHRDAGGGGDGDGGGAAGWPGGVGGETAAGAGTIWVRLEEAGGEVRVAVADDGVGLPADDRQRLVEPYVTHKPKGTGLGLAIVKKIMEDHAGLIVLDDRSDGPGAVATLILPVKLPDAA